MNELFDFGSRPIRVIPKGYLFHFVHEKEGWIIAIATPLYIYEKTFSVSDAEDKFMGKVSGLGNLETLVSQIYDQQYGPDATPINWDYPLWVVFARISDGTQEANFSREVSAPSREGAEEAFLVQVHADQVLEPTEIIAVYGPYMRA
jgi:hypothetical protein